MHSSDFCTNSKILLNTHFRGGHPQWGWEMIFGYFILTCLVHI